MNHPSLSLLCAFSVAASLLAQEPTQEAIPSPKTAHHGLLTPFVGTWRTESKMAAMPNVPGMEKPTEMAGTETAELVCDGLWLKVTGEGVCGGQACSGVWLLGYDPVAKSYQCIAASSMDEAACSITGRYDETAKVWHFEGETPMGPFRSEFVFENADRSVETCYAKSEDGKETEFMRIVRTRTKGVAPQDAAAKPPAAADAAETPAPLAALHAEFGTWDADFRMEMPGAPPMSSKCREVVRPICSGKWTWSDFTGSMMNAPFEGHALTGYDSKTGKIVSFWIDSMNSASMRTEGTYDLATRTFTMSGTCYDQQGQSSPVASTVTASGKDARKLRTVFGEGQGQHVMTIAYRRAGR